MDPDNEAYEMPSEVRVYTRQTENRVEEFNLGIVISSPNMSLSDFLSVCP